MNVRMKMDAWTQQLGGMNWEWDSHACSAMCKTDGWQRARCVAQPSLVLWGDLDGWDGGQVVGSPKRQAMCICVVS